MNDAKGLVDKIHDTPQTILRAAASFFCGTLFSRITGMLRDVLMAFAFGTEPILAAFFVAFRFSHLLRRIFGEGALQSAFIPQFEELRAGPNGSKGRSISFFVELYAVLFLILLGVIVVGMLTCSFFPGEIVKLTMIMFPSLLFICLAGLNTALLQCEKSYFLPGISPVAFNVVWIGGVITLSATHAGPNMEVLSLWVVLACFCQWLVTMPQVVRIVRENGAPFQIFSKNWISQDLRKLWRPFCLAVLGVGAAQINSACDALFARFADSSGPAYLWYAIRLQQLPLALFGIALGSALMPPLSRAIKSRDLVNAQLLLQSAVERTLLLMVPITCAIFVLGERSIDFLYGYGDFNPISVKGTAYALYGYTLGLIPMALILLLAPLFYAREDYRTPAFASVASMVLNIALNALFVLGWHGGAFYVALATSISAWMNAIYLVIRMDAMVRKSVFNAIVASLCVMRYSLPVGIFVTVGFTLWVPFGDRVVYKGISMSLLTLLYFGLFVVLLPKFVNYRHFFFEQKRN